MLVQVIELVFYGFGECVGEVSSGLVMFVVC